MSEKMVYKIARGFGRRKMVQKRCSKTGEWITIHIFPRKTTRRTIEIYIQRLKNKEE